MVIMRRSAVLGASILFLITIYGCSLTKVDSRHPLLLGDEGVSATVYFLRPHTERRMGFADNSLTVELNQEKLMLLGKGEYTRVNLVPRDYTVTLRNQSETGPRWFVKDMRRSYDFTFEDGQTYFLVVRPVDGEFRGIHFMAKSVDLFEAKQLAKTLRAVGAARSAKITSMSVL